MATPALIRDFAPQVGRATAMGFWTIGPVLGSLTVSGVNTLTLPIYQTWQSQFVICGVLGLLVFALAFLFLRELAPALRDQLMVSERDRVLVELKAKGLDIEASLRNPWRQMMHVDIIASALGVSVMLLAYYTAVGFRAHLPGDGLPVQRSAGERTRELDLGCERDRADRGGSDLGPAGDREPFTLAGGIGSAVMLCLYLLQAGQHPSFATLALISCVQTVFGGFAFVTWMASFTETVEAHNPALTATGLAIWGWLVRLVITACFLCLPLVVTSVTPLIEAPYYIAAYQRALANHVTPSAPLLEALGAIKAAAAAAPGDWQVWYWICIGGVVAFIATIFVMRGRWSPAAAHADEVAHDAAVARELHALQGS